MYEIKENIESLIMTLKELSDEATYLADQLDGYYSEFLEKVPSIDLETFSFMLDFYRDTTLNPIPDLDAKFPPKEDEPF